MASPEWPQRARVMSDAGAKASFDTPQGKALFGLIPFGVLLGIPAALGLIPGNVLVVLAALMACMVARGFLSRPDDLPAGWRGSQAWFLALAWSIAAFPLYANSFDLREALAVQAVLGAAPLNSGGRISAALWLALLAGLVSAAGWSEALPRISRPISPANEAVDAIARWAESALAGAAVAGIVWGPSLGALISGPADRPAVSRVAISFGITCVAVGVVSFSRRFLGRMPQMSAAAGAGGLAMLAMTVSALGR